MAFTMDDVSITLTLPEDLVDAMHSACDRMGITLSHYVENLVREAEEI